MKTVRNILRTPELVKKIGFTLLIIVLYRFGVSIPTPGVNLVALENLNTVEASPSGLGASLALLSSIGGGSSIFALGVIPYITASIMMQILTIAVPKLEEWQSQGAVGQRKINQWTRYVALGLAAVQSVAVIIGMNNGIFGPQFVSLFDSTEAILLGVLGMTVGTAIVMWLAELNTQRGIGNGMSVLIFASVVASIPAIGDTLRSVQGNFPLILGIILLVALIVAIVFIENGLRKIPVHYAKRVVGRKEYRGNRNFIPLKVNQAGVIPVIFASSLIIAPTFIVNLLPAGPVNDPNIWNTIQNFFINDFGPLNIFYNLIFGLLIIGFAYFYNAIQFDPARKADELNKSGGFIPGVRPGPQTDRYLSRILNRITLPGSIFLAAVALIPTVLITLALGDQHQGGNIGLASFGGISILIGVGVSLEMMKQINAQLLARNYEGFLK